MVAYLANTNISLWVQKDGPVILTSQGEERILKNIGGWDKAFLTS